MGYLRDLSGQKFGRLQVTDQYKRLRGDNGKTLIYWLCKCDCGKEKYLLSASLTSTQSPTKSCGCIRKEGKNRLSDDIFRTNFIYNRYKRGAKKRKIDFKLSKQELGELIISNCFYCASEPRTVKSYDRKRTVTYNGIDRVDNNLGYEIKNCVTCCYHCNTAKMDLSEEEFKEWLVKLLVNLQKIGYIK